MANISGQGAVIQFGKQTAWGITPVTATKQVEFTSESLKLNLNYIDSNALLGNVTTNRRDPAGQSCEGGMSMIVHPNNIGMLLSAALGSEGAATLVGGCSTIYAHSFSCLPCGSAYSMPKLTVIVDRVQKCVAYPSVKIDSLTLSAKPNDYLRADFSFRGIGEVDGTKASLSYSTLRPFQFIDLSITIDGTPVTDVTDFKLDLKNNLENNLYTTSSPQYMSEVEPQGREITGTLEFLYQTEAEGLRSSKFVAGAALSAVFTFTSTETAGEGEKYKLLITLPTAYITDAPANVGGKERIKIPITLSGCQATGGQPIIIGLIYKQGTKYIT
jgi:hypothetical protein